MDQDFQFIKRQTEPFVNMQHVAQKNGQTTGTYNAVLDQTGEMQLALADMQINEDMDVHWMSAYQSILSEARLIIIDLNLPYESVEYLLTLARQFEIEEIGRAHV